MELQEESEIIGLQVEGELFHVRKNVLCSYSDYFKAMFRGNYVENFKTEIKINVVDADSMRLILKYMENGMIDLTELPLSTISDLSVSANFLQIVELLTQIEYTLDTQLSLCTWVEIMDIACASAFPKLEKLAASFGLLSFAAMKVEYIPNLQKLYWYLSHPYLNGDELSIFLFGLQWVIKNKLSADALLVILGCLDIASLTMKELTEMQDNLKEFEFSLAASLVDFLIEIHKRKGKITVAYLSKYKMELVSLHSETVYKETQLLVQETRDRKLSLVPVLSASSTDVCKAEKNTQFLYTFNENGPERWLEFPEVNLWGWSMTRWDANRLVVVGGEYGRGSGVFLRQVLVWDTLRKEWNRHGVELPPRRHAGLAVKGNQLYIVGGVGQFRIVLSSVTVYNLKERTFRNLQDIPDAIQNPPLCVHKDVLYVGAAQSIYRLVEMDASDRWECALETRTRCSWLVAHGEDVYVTQSYFSSLWRWRPGPGSACLEPCGNFTNPVAAICSNGKRLVAFTQEMCGPWSRGVLSAEEYCVANCETRLLWSDAASELKVNEVCGCCPLVLDPLPPLSPAPASGYATRYLARFTDDQIETHNQIT